MACKNKMLFWEEYSMLNDHLSSSSCRGRCDFRGPCNIEPLEALKSKIIVASESDILHTKCLNGLAVWFLLWVYLNCRRSPVQSRVEANSLLLFLHFLLLTTSPGVQKYVDFLHASTQHSHTLSKGTISFENKCSSWRVHILLLSSVGIVQFPNSIMHFHSYTHYILWIREAVSLLCNTRTEWTFFFCVTLNTYDQNHWSLVID